MPEKSLNQFLEKKSEGAFENILEFPEIHEKTIRNALRIFMKNS